MTCFREEILVQMEDKQGRLEFPEDEVQPKKKGRPRKQTSGDAAVKHAG
jgi:hypothetical protein